MDEHEQEHEQAQEHEHEDPPPPSPAEEALYHAMKNAYDAAVAIEPAAEIAAPGDVARLGKLLDEVAARAGEALAEMSEDDVAGAERTLALVYARCAAVAIAARDDANAQRWLGEAHGYAHDEAREELAAAQRSPERYRTLVHGRNLFANGKERQARKLWRALAKGERDALAKAAGEELVAPRPLNGKMPSLWTYNGFGLRFSGKRDRWPDGSYATTQCVSALWIPLFPIAAYRVADDDDGGWYVMAREQLSKLARVVRYTIVLAIVGGIAFAALNSYLNDPTRVARKHFDATLASAATSDPEVALRRLGALVEGEDAWRAGAERMARAGAEIVKRTAALAPAPFTAEHVDHANRLVARYQALPERARAGAASDALVDVLEGWHGQLGAGAATADARLALLVHAAAVADARRAGPLSAKVTAARPRSPTRAPRTGRSTRSRCSSSSRTPRRSRARRRSSSASSCRRRCWSRPARISIAGSPRRRPPARCATRSWPSATRPRPRTPRPTTRSCRPRSSPRWRRSGRGTSASPCGSRAPRRSPASSMPPRRG